MSQHDMSLHTASPQADQASPEASPTRVLLVDDEATLREPLADYLTQQGFAVTQADSATHARTALAQADADPASARRPDIVLLDILRPGEDGLSLCRHLVETRSLPVIFLTAKTEATDRIVGLELGADDYVLKPFEPRELVARIRTVLRRVARSAEGALPDTATEDWHYLFEDWALDPLKRELTDPEGVIVPIWTWCKGAPRSYLTARSTTRRAACAARSRGTPKTRISSRPCAAAAIALARWSNAPRPKFKA